MTEFFGMLVSSVPGAVAQGLIWGVMALGVYITFRILDIADLTVDGSFCTGAAVCTMLITGGAPTWLAMLCALAAGLLAGLLTGLIHTKLGIPAILAGILTQLILWSANLKIQGRANVALPSRIYNVYLATSNIGKSLLVLVGICGAVIALLYIFFGTELGCAMRATGCNASMSRAQGINTNLTKVLGLMFSNALVAFSGAMLAQYQGFSDINMGRGAIVIGLAAVIIGEVIFSKIARNFAVRLTGVLLGGVVYYIVLQFVIGFGIDTDLLKMLSAVVVGIFLGVPYIKKTVKQKMAVKRGAQDA